MTLKVVHVEWLDSTAVAVWDDPLEIEQLPTTHSAGFLIKETNNSLVLALSFDPDTAEVNSYKQIPLAAIKKMRTLCKIKT